MAALTSDLGPAHGAFILLLRDILTRPSQTDGPSWCLPPSPALTKSWTTQKCGTIIPSVTPCLMFSFPFPTCVIIFLQRTVGLIWPRTSLPQHSYEPVTRKATETYIWSSLTPFQVCQVLESLTRPCVVDPVFLQDQGYKSEHQKQRLPSLALQHILLDKSMTVAIK